MRPFVLSLGLVLPLLAQEESGSCDLKTLEEDLFCAKCVALLGKEGVDKDGSCRSCHLPPEKVQVCAKKYYYAACCKTKHAGPGECCGKAFIQKTSRARVIHVCRACGTEGPAGAVCTRDRCRSKGKPLERRCSRNGEFPHGGEP